MTESESVFFKRFLNKFKIKGVRSNYFQIMIFVGIISLLLLGLISIISMNNVLKNETIYYHTQNLRQKDLYIDLVMNNIESLIVNISGNKDVNEALAEKPADSANGRLAIQAKIGHILSGYTNLKGLISIDIFTNYGMHYRAGETLEFDENRDLKDRLFNEVSASSDLVYWSGIENNINQDSGFRYVIMAAKLLKPTRENTDLFDPNAGGLLIISYKPAILGEAVNTKNGNSGYSIVLDSKNRILYHSDPDLIGTTIPDTIAMNIGAQPGNFEQSVNGNNMLAIYDKTQKGNWTVADFIPVSNFYSDTYMVTLVFVLLIAAAGFLLVAFQTMFSRQVLRPIKQITNTFKLLKNGQLENAQRLDIKTNDELGELRNLFNDFIDAREDITTQRKLERQLNRQNLELHKALERLKETQAQMLSQEKLAGIGQLAAGVAHEINNPLGFVTANFDILKKYIHRYEDVLQSIQPAALDSMNEKDLNAQIKDVWNESKLNFVLKDMQELLSDTDEGLERIANIVNGLKSFSRIRQGDENVAYNLNEGIKTTLLVAFNELKYYCDISFEEGEIPEIYANGGEINQVILNILLNAVYAIREKFRDKKGEIKIKTYVDGLDVILSVCDNGSGMPEEVKSKIFEPFFTTKPVGQGTGLGLGIAYEIIYNKHCGTIEVDSVQGKGTCFKIHLPINSPNRK